MIRRFSCLLIALVVCSSAYAAKERLVLFQNHVQFGYDDNIYSRSDAEDSFYVSDIINLSSEFNFSSRSEALLYWQPVFTYRPDASDNEFITSQNLFGKLDHAVSERLTLLISDHVQYQPKEGQSQESVNQEDQEYFNNEIKGALEYVLSPQSIAKVGAGYEVRVWDDDAYGKGINGNNFEKVEADGSLVRQLKADTTQGMIGANYTSLEYEGSRGGYDSITVMTGLDHLFSSDLTGYGRVGASFTSVDSNVPGGSDSDSTTPYFDAGLTLNPEGRTSIDIIGTLGFSSYRSQNSLYNLQDRFNFGTSIRHDLTAKITLAAAVSYTMGFYESEYATAQGETAGDLQDDFLTFSARCSYQINRNNFVEAGYEFEDRSSDSDLLADWDRSRVNMAWRVRL